MMTRIWGSGWAIFFRTNGFKAKSEWEGCLVGIFAVSAALSTPIRRCFYL